MDRLENAVDRLLQRNAEIQNQCERLLVEQQAWQHQRRALLAEVEMLLADLVLLQEQQA